MVTLTGSGFAAAGNEVTLDGVPCAVVTESSTEVQCTVGLKPGAGGAASCKDVLREDPSAESGWYAIVLPSGTEAEAWCDMRADGGGYTAVPVAAGVKSYRSTDWDSCKAMGLQMVVPRTRAHLNGLLAQFGSSYFSTAPGVTNPSGGRKYTDTQMNYAFSPKAREWAAVAGGSWFLKGSTAGEPNGDYTADCWLKMSCHSCPEVNLNDYRCRYGTSKYVCSPNDKDDAFARAESTNVALRVPGRGNAKVGTASGGCHITPNTERFGVNLVQGSANRRRSAALCCDACGATPECATWTWNRETQDCFLQKEGGTSSTNWACDSGSTTVLHFKYLSKVDALARSASAGSLEGGLAYELRGRGFHALDSPEFGPSAWFLGQRALAAATFANSTLVRATGDGGAALLLAEALPQSAFFKHAGGAKCASTAHQKLSNDLTVAGCARACQLRSDCEYFLSPPGIALNGATGKCYAEKNTPCGNLELDGNWNTYRLVHRANTAAWARVATSDVLLSDEATPTLVSASPAGGSPGTRLALRATNLLGGGERADVELELSPDASLAMQKSAEVFEGDVRLDQAAWTAFNGSLFKAFVGEGRTWPDARAQCRKLGGELATTRSLATAVFLGNLTAGFFDTLFWVGYFQTEARSAEYQWADGTPAGEAVTLWAATQPNGGTERYAGFTTGNHTLCTLGHGCGAGLPRANGSWTSCSGTCGRWHDYGGGTWAGGFVCEAPGTHRRTASWSEHVDGHFAQAEGSARGEGLVYVKGGFAHPVAR